MSFSVMLSEWGRVPFSNFILAYYGGEDGDEGRFNSLNATVSYYVNDSIIKTMFDEINRTQKGHLLDDYDGIALEDLSFNLVPFGAAPEIPAEQPSAPAADSPETTVTIESGNADAEQTTSATVDGGDNAPIVKLTLKKVTVKKSAKKLVLQATVKENGKAVKGKRVTFKFNGKKYTAKTDRKGIAKVTIKKSVLKKLKKGKSISYSATYGKFSVKKTVKVK